MNTASGNMDEHDNVELEYNTRDVEKADDNVQSSSASDTNNDGIDKEHNDPLNSLEIRNLVFCLLAWAATVCNLTLVVGTSAVAVQSIGASDDMVSVPLGAFFIGASFVSLTTPQLFKYGRKIGFLVGILLGYVAVSLVVVALIIESPALFIIAQVFYGMYSGVGFYLRFAAVEVVPAHFAAKSVTLVVSGGCIAAFCGPESARATQNWIAEYNFMGNAIISAVYLTLNTVFISLVAFPAPKQKQSTDENDSDENSSIDNMTLFDKVKYILYNKDFLVPLSVSAISWASMGMPMSMVRVVMGKIGYTSRQSLTVMELHFLGMYGPGFITGNLIQKYGAPAICAVSTVIYGIAVVLMNLADNDTMVLWILGLVTVGIAWNFGFTGATVWLSRVYSGNDLKSLTQALHDSLMFALAGGPVIASSFIVRAVSDDMVLDGWRALNYIVVGLSAVSLSILVWNYIYFSNKASS